MIELENKPTNWMQKSEQFFNKENDMTACPQGNTYGGLEPKSMVQFPARPGKAVVASCKHCGHISFWDWYKIKKSIE